MKMEENTKVVTMAIVDTEDEEADDVETMNNIETSEDITKDTEE